MNCPRCGAGNADTHAFCSNCGTPLRAGAQPPPAPSAPPPYGYPPPQPAPVPVCMACRSPYLQYFENGKGACAVCKYIFRWGYLPTGQIFIMPGGGIF